MRRCRLITRRFSPMAPVVAILAVVALVAIDGCAADGNMRSRAEEYAACFRRHGRHCSTRVLDGARTGTLHSLGVDAMGPALATIHVPGGLTIGIVPLLRGCSDSHGCYRQLGTVSLPATYERPMRRKRSRRLPNVDGPVFSNASPGERRAGVIDVVGENGCAGPEANERPYALAYGLLRQRRDTVTANADGRVQSFKEAAIPARLDPEGVLVYALLQPGVNTIVVRSPRGHVMTRLHWGDLRQTQCSG